MLIWGTRRTVAQLAVLMLTCPQGHPAAHTVLRLVTKFTLFFVPLFPIRVRHVVQCTLCGYAGEVDRSRAEQLVATASQPSGPSPSPQPQPGPGQPGARPRQAGP